MTIDDLRNYNEELKHHALPERVWREIERFITEDNIQAIQAACPLIMVHFHEGHLIDYEIFLQIIAKKINELAIKEKYSLYAYYERSELGDGTKGVLKFNNYTIHYFGTISCLDEFTQLQEGTLDMNHLAKEIFDSITGRCAMR